MLEGFGAGYEVFGVNENVSRIHGDSLMLSSWDEDKLVFRFFFSLFISYRLWTVSRNCLKYVTINFEASIASWRFSK